MEMDKDLLLKLLMDPIYGPETYDDSPTLLQQFRDQTQRKENLNTGMTDPRGALDPDILMQLLNPGQKMGKKWELGGVATPHILPPDEDILLHPKHFMANQGDPDQDI